MKGFWAFLKRKKLPKTKDVQKKGLKNKVCIPPKMIPWKKSITSIKKTKTKVFLVLFSAFLVVSTTVIVNCWFGLVVWDSRGTPK